MTAYRFAWIAMILSGLVIGQLFPEPRCSNARVYLCQDVEGGM